MIGSWATASQKAMPVVKPMDSPQGPSGLAPMPMLKMLGPCEELPAAKLVNEGIGYQLSAAQHRRWDICKASDHGSIYCFVLRIYIFCFKRSNQLCEKT